MSQQVVSTESGAAQASPGGGEHGVNKLGAFLCWAVVFADIGTSVYYTPGILFGQFGRLAGFFVTLTMFAFVLLAIKYAEVSVRFPEGGGVVTVSARALSPWMGALGGMFILVDYFLTAAISSLSGLQYFQDVFPPIQPYVLPVTVVVIVLLGILNWWGIKESAMVSLYIAIAAFISDIVILVAVLTTVPLHEVLALIGSIFRGSSLTPVTVLAGFAGAFLAFSGLESISQLSPVMAKPRSRTVTIALGLVVVTVGLTSPLLTILSTTLLDGAHNHLLPHQIAHIDPNQFISQLGGAFAGPVVGVATAVIASALLIFASNTAIIGTYHVFLALSRMSFFPAIVEKRDRFRGTPFVSIALATGIPIAILIIANGQIDLLGQLYAFGLLGAFSLTCVSLDALRIRERLTGGKQFTLHEEEMEAEAAETARLTGGIAPLPVAIDSDYDEDEDEDELIAAGQASGSSAAGQTVWQRAVDIARRGWRQHWPQVNFWLGLLTTVMVLTAWVTNLIDKRDATIFGGSLTVVGMAIAILHYRWTKQRGVNTVQPSWAVSLAPDSVFAIVRTGGLEQNQRIIESAFRAAHGRKVLVLFLSSHMPTSARIMQINDPALRDDEAQDAFRLAERLSEGTHSPVQVFYRIGAVNSAASLWRVARSMEVVTDVETAHAFAASVAPTYIRYRRVGDATIAHLIIRPKAAIPAVPTAATPAAGAARQSPPRALPGGRPPSTYDDDTGSFNDETWIEEYRDLEDAYSGARSRPLSGPGQNGRGAATGQSGRAGERQAQGEQRQFGEEPRPDHEHDGDTAPRHPVKIVHSLLPSQSGVTEAPRQAPRPTAPPARPNPPRMSEPTPIEADDEDWYWNGEDLVRYDETPTRPSDTHGARESEKDDEQ
ncbi:MAG TPA: APC family permease [Ktedonobacterales bacterium]|nr:APC family permease [Ktedonobacterales bacterium]